MSDLMNESIGHAGGMFDDDQLGDSSGVFETVSLDRLLEPDDSDDWEISEQDEGPVSLHEQIPDTTATDPSALLISEEWLREVLSRLTPLQRQTIALYCGLVGEGREWKHAEIARVLKTARSTVSERHGKALRHLRAALRQGLDQ